MEKLLFLRKIVFSINQYTQRYLSFKTLMNAVTLQIKNLTFPYYGEKIQSPKWYKMAKNGKTIILT